MTEHSIDVPSAPSGATAPPLIRLRVRGLVQGVGFRPTVWRIARHLGLTGDVRNDGDGVLIRLWAHPVEVERFRATLVAQCPPLARIDQILIDQMQSFGAPATGAGQGAGGLPSDTPPPGFRIVESAATRVRTGVVPDAATCAACAAEIGDPADRRFRYPFTNCTHCGPRLSIIRAIPYDRANTSMATFWMCPACQAEYRDPADRRFHAQPNACPVCGPRVWLETADGAVIDPTEVGAIDAIDAASRLLAAGHIVAIKGIGGVHLACDATNGAAVAELRRRKQRYAKPFALMARDLDVIRHECRVSDAEAALLGSPIAPIVLLERRLRVTDAPASAPGVIGAGEIDPGVVHHEGVAPGQDSLGYLLPYSPLHRLLLADWSRPLVMTSGNLSDEPQCIDNTEAASRLATIADALLLHDRAIVNRVDDSVLRVTAGQPRWLRRARGGAPAPLPLPVGLEGLPPVLALGGELKNTIALLKDGQAILSQHLGDLDEARTAREFERTIGLYQDLYQHRPAAIAVDLHPDYRSTQVGRRLAADWGVPLVPVQHHAAHLAAVLADSGRPLAAPPVIGLILDGLGYGGDGSIWGGELLLGDYRAWRRIGHLRQVALPGGERAIREPWRNLYAQIVSAFGWEGYRARWPGLPLTRALGTKPLGVLARMVESGLGTPQTSSAGRLFDAVAAALGICFDGIAYEGQAAIELEVLARRAAETSGYPFAVRDDGARLILDPAPMWVGLFDDLATGLAREQIAARFHTGLTNALADLLQQAARREGADAVALSGGVFQNRTLFEGLITALATSGLEVLTHTRVPTNDGGLALGQAVLAAVQVSADGRG